MKQRNPVKADFPIMLVCDGCSFYCSWIRSVNTYNKNKKNEPEQAKVDRFLKLVKKEKGGECWEWQGALNHNGYGVVRKGKIPTYLAHRRSYEFFKGEIPKGLFIRHRCDNPKCVNPKHLLKGTAKQNSQDALRRGGIVIPIKFPKDHIIAIRVLFLFMGWKKSELQNVFGISYQHLKDVLSGKYRKDTPTDTEELRSIGIVEDNNGVEISPLIDNILDNLWQVEEKYLVLMIQY